MDQINEIGLFIAKLIGKLKKQVEEKQEDQLLAEARDALTVQFGWELDELLYLDKSAFLSTMEESLLSEEHFEKLSEVFHVLGDYALEHETLLQRELYFQKALWLLEHAELQSSTFSMTRRDKMVNLEVKLKN